MGNRRRPTQICDTGKPGHRVGTEYQNKEHPFHCFSSSEGGRVVESHVGPCNSILRWRKRRPCSFASIVVGASRCWVRSSFRRSLRAPHMPLRLATHKRTSPRHPPRNIQEPLPARKST